MVWRKDLYLAEAYRQLSDGNFYQRIPEDATQENHSIVRSFVERAIEANELAPSATNLLVEHARTSKFYLLPKIHKPGNPGRPIVSACACPTEHLASYLDKLTAPFVRQLGSYVKDTTHMLQLLDSFQFSEDGQHRLVFTMDIKSLYTIIPNDEGLLALKYFLDKRENKDPPADTLVRMAELVLTFNGEYYKQVGGVAMGSKLGPNYACLFVGYVEEKMLAEYPGEKPELYKRYMDDVAGATSCSEQELQRFLEFASNYHPKIDYTWSVSADKLQFLDIYMIPRGNRIETSIYFKDTHSHSYLDFGSSHPSKCKTSIPYSQFLRLRKICSDDDDFHHEISHMERHFAARGYPQDVITRARVRAEAKRREDLLISTAGNETAVDRPPLVITYHPKNVDVCNIIQRNFSILRNDQNTRVIYNKLPLKAFRRAKNLKDLLVHSSLPTDPQIQVGTFKCNRRDCRTCPFLNSSDRIRTNNGHIKISGHYTYITSQLV